MKRSSLALPTCFLCALLVVACSDSDRPSPGDPGVIQGPNDGGAADTGAGLDSRPSNTTCIAPERPVQPSGVRVERVFPSLTFVNPMLVAQAPGESERIWVAERAGVLKFFPNSPDVTGSQVVTALDFSSRVNGAGEGGFLGMAFHPEWPAKAELFVSYTDTFAGARSGMRSVISRFRSSNGGQSFDPDSHEVILTLEQPYPNHNGGGIAFGPDGFLYIGFGDGGSGDDPENSGQTLGTLLGKFLRIDVNVPAAERYRIPPTNPFVNKGGERCGPDAPDTVDPTVPPCLEVFAYGFRNPFRWSFDTATGELWAGDVGQSRLEEVDRVESGGNYGWKIREGTVCRADGSNNCPSTNLIPPVVEYGRDEGRSITGGQVYRGTAIPGLVGRYVFGDFETGRIWATTQDPETAAFGFQLLAAPGLHISAFGQLANGEMLVVDFSGGLYQLLPQDASEAAVSTVAERLSLTGCFDSANPTQPLPALIPYDVNAALWSDGADKSRWFAIPDGTSIEVKADGDWEFPNGTVLAKEFRLGGKPVETRLFMRHPDGFWAGYSYEWNSEGTDATLLPGGKTKLVNEQSWSFPSSGDCISCHTAGAGRSLGLETAQLNRTFTYPSTRRTRNQLETLEALGFFSSPLGSAPAQLPKLEAPGGTGPLAERARAYLHANCSNCHREGEGRGGHDFRYSLPLSEMKACDVVAIDGDLGLGADARIIKPGSPSLSIASVRMHALNAYRMPPLSSAKVDTEGTALVDAWIASLNGCQ